MLHVIGGLVRVRLEISVPLISVVHTPKDSNECIDLMAFFNSHLSKKLTDTSRACIATIAAMQALQPQD